MGNKGHVPSIGERKRAIDLKAVDAVQLLNSQLPAIAPLLTKEQIKQVQEVLDAAVVNPEIEKEYDELMKKAIVSVTDSLGAYRDPDKVRKANKVLQGRILVTDKDRRIRLDFRKLLDADALKARTDNPDEVAYLEKMRQTLTKKGIWLRISQPFVRNPQQPSSWMIDPRKFEVWLSLGPDGDQIPIGGGPITRENLLANNLLGAGYYREVHEGQVERILQLAIKNLLSQISTGETLHEQQESARSGAAPLVVPISDALGGADYPSMKIWDTPRKLVNLARNQNVGGNVKEASETLLYAAAAAGAAAEILHEYIEATVKGAKRAVTVLAVIVAIDAILGSVMIVRGLVGALIRHAAKRSAPHAISAGAGKNFSPSAYYPTNHNSLPAHYPTRPHSMPDAHYPTNFRGQPGNQPGFEKTMKLGQTMHTDAGFGTAINRVDLATQQTINGWHKEFDRRVKELMIQKGETGGGWVVSRDEFVKLDKEVSSTWGDIWALWD